MRSDIAFSSDDSHRFLPWLIGMMVALAALLLCFVVTINGWVIAKGSDYSNNITINIPVSNGEQAPSDEVVGKVIDAVQQVSSVKSVSRIEQKKLQSMLVPWLGEDIANSDLPLPVVLDVTLKNGADIDVEKLQATITQISAGIEIDKHEAWVAAFLSFSAAVRAVITMFAVLIIVAIGLMIAFTSRASLHLHSKAVRLLHSIGAHDGYIARQFQNNACVLTMRGALVGCTVAAIGFWAMGYYMESLGNAAIPSLAMNEMHFALLFAVVITCGVVAAITARLSVVKQLRLML